MLDSDPRVSCTRRENLRGNAHFLGQNSRTIGEMSSRHVRILRPLWCRKWTLCGCMLACSAELQETPGEFVNYLHEDSLQPCAGTANYIDNFAIWTATSLGIELTREIEYFWLSSEEYSKTDCPDGSVGCQISGHIYSRNPDLLHEVVHAITAQAGMNTLPFFTEGIAVAFDPWPGGSAGPRYKFTPPLGQPQGDPRIYMTMPAAEVYYDLAGAFVSFLILRHGAEKLVSFMRRPKGSVDYATISSLFYEHYGVSLDDEAEAFIANTPCDESWTSSLPYDCTSTVVPWDDLAWSWGTTLSCTEPDIVGGIGPELSLSHLSVTLDIPNGGLYEVRTSSSEKDTRITLGKCFGCPWYPSDLVLEGNEVQLVELSAGTHFLRATANSRTSPHVTVSLLPK